MNIVDKKYNNSNVKSQVPGECLLDTVFANPIDVFNLPDLSILKNKYDSAEPYSHVVIDNFFQDYVLRNMQDELLSNDVNFSELFVDGMQSKKTISTGEDVPALISLIAAKFASPEMLRYLEKITGLKKLIPDPFYNTDYGYYHIIGSGGVLGSHVDHSRHSSLRIPHVLNLVVYITTGWSEKDGGALCLYDSTGKNIEKRIFSEENRAVIFSCTPTAFHGVEPISDSCDKRRHSLYFAYYSVDNLSKEGTEGFPSIQKAKSNEDENSNYGTYFIVPIKDLIKPKNWIHLRARLIYLAKYFLPPFVIDFLKIIIKLFR